MSDNDKVICPSCVHEFRAVPVNVQDELSALRADAERYRWLRDTAFHTTAVRLMMMKPNEMDQAIDHAMQMSAAPTVDGV